MFDVEQRRQKVLFALVDQTALLGAAGLALALHDPAGAMAGQLRRTDPAALALALMAAALGWLLVFRSCGLYRLRNGGAQESVAVLKACVVALALTLFIAFLAHLQLSRLTLMLILPVSVLLVRSNRALLRRLIRHLYADPKIAIPVVIVGQDALAHYVCDRIREELTQYELLGFIGPECSAYRGPVLGGEPVLAELAARHRNLEVFIILPEDAPAELERIVRRCEELRVHWRMVPRLFGAPGRELLVDMIGAVPLIGPRCSNIEGLNLLLKRAFDIAAACAALLCAGPLMLLAGAALWLTQGRPLLFRQVRLGRHGRPFELLKFRTMTVSAADLIHRQYVQQWITAGAPAGAHFKLSEDPRVTAVGRWLRRFSLDELPQLINVLRGEMSLIGPRPALPYELELYQSWHRRRLDAPPGITGLWQVSGRNQLSFEQMVRLDIEYIDNWSLAKDLSILLRTLPAMLSGGGL
ncbi:MAG TPA: sugar transferase [Candidatus Binataceae bacterium]|nr:sugar transferase [Candidatus Binataceae bacterium]